MKEGPEESEGAVRWRFAGFELDERSQELRRDGQVLALERKPLEVLMLLLRQAGEVVTKDELAEGVWTRRVMDDQVIARAIGKLRQALGEKGPELIKTVHGYGYRLVAPVRVEAHPSPAPTLRLDIKPGDRPPLRPHWKLAECLGAGGFGEVWLARHDKTGETRVFKFAADGPALTALKREATVYRLIKESLGERTDIVRLLDWNFDSAPYFVECEQVEGGSLDQWLVHRGGAQGVPLATRLELVAQIAETLAAVHALGVLHKDLKPANVLVDGATSPQIKLCDFGSGRILDDQRLQALGITRAGFTQTIATDSSSGTLRYLAPEVLAGQPLTLGADIYALGVILYQLVIGDLKESLAPGWERGVEDELLREDIAAAADGDPKRRLTDAAEMARRLRSLPERRRALAAQRRADRAAEALRATMQREVARRGLQYALAATMLVGFAATAWLYLDAARSRDAAVESAKTADEQKAAAEAVTNFLTDDLLASANPQVAGRADVKVQEVLDLGAARVHERFGDQPLLRARLQLIMGTAYANLLNKDRSIPLLEEAEKGLAQLLGDAAPETQSAREMLAEIHGAILPMDFAAERAAMERIVAAERSSDTPNLRLEFRMRQKLAELDCLQRYGAVYVSNCGDALLPVYEDALRKLGIEAEYVVALRGQMGGLYGAARRPVDALRHLQPYLEQEIHRRGSDAPETQHARMRVAYAMREAERYAEMEPLIDAAIELYSRSMGPTHRYVLNARSVRAGMYSDTGRHERAIKEGRAILELRKRESNPSQLHIWWAEYNLGSWLLRAGQHAEAEQKLRRSLDAFVAASGAGDPDAIEARDLLGLLYQQTGRLDRAENLLRQNLQEARAKLGTDVWLLGHCIWRLGEFERARGRTDKARVLLDEAVVVLSDAVGEDSPRVRRARRSLDQLQKSAGSPPVA